jgi:sensor histidine kinase YesM
MILVYVNTLFLAPRFLAHKRYGWYFLYITLLTIVVSVVYTFMVKIAGRYFDVDHIQQMSYVSSPVSNKWTLSAIIDDTTTYFIGNILWVLVFTMAWYTRDYYRQQRAAEEARRKQVETELHFLKSQVNPHFLFNTLNNVYGLALKKSDNTPDVVLKLSSILRYMLYESNTDTVDFDKEKEVMQAYIELELLRITDTSGLHFDIRADRNYKLPPLLWLPVLENVFKHGTRFITDKLFVDFRLAIVNNVLTIHAENTSKPVTDKADTAGGIGLVNLSKRLSILYPGRHTISQQQNGDRYAIDVTIELS